MAIFYDFKLKITRQFAALLRRNVRPEDIEFGVPSGAPAGATYNTQVTLKDRVTGQTRLFTYNRTPLSDLIEATVPLKLKTLAIGRASHVADLVPLLNLQLGLPCNVSDFVNESLDNSTSYTLKAASGSLAYTGSCVIGLTRSPVLAVQPDYEWGRNGSLENTGLQYGYDLAASQFRQIDIDGVTYVGSAAGVYGSFPLALPANGNFTMDIELIAEPFVNTGTFGAIFNNAASGAAANGSLFTLSETYLPTRGNTPYLNAIGYNTAVPAEAVNLPWRPLSRKARRLTVVRNGTAFTLYEDGVLVWSVTSSLTTAVWQYFGRSDDRLLAFRNLRWWNRALSANEVNQVLSVDTRPEWEFQLTRDSNNTGRLTLKPLTTLGPSMVPGAAGAALRHPGIQWLDPRLSFRVSGEFTLEFDVTLADIRAYRTFLSTDSTQPKAHGSLVFENNQLVEVGVTPADRSKLPVLQPGVSARVTLRSYGGNHELYFNGVFALSYPAPTYKDKFLVAFRDSDDPALQWGSKDLVKNLRYWSAPTNSVTPGYSAPLNEFLFQGSGRNTGTSGLPWTAPVNYETINDEQWVSFSGSAPTVLGGDVRFKVWGDYTVDFELMVDQVYAELNLFTGNPTLSTQPVAFALRNNRFYEVGVTPTTAEWESKVPALTPGVKQRITVRSANGYSSIWIDGVYRFSYTCLAQQSLRYLTGWRDTSTGIQLPAGVKFRNIRSWTTGLDFKELQILCGGKADPLTPLHYWPLASDGRNLGTDGRNLPGSWSQYQAAGKIFSRSSIKTIIPADFALNTAGEYTLDLEVSHNPGTGYGPFISAATWASLGAFTYYAGRLYHYEITPSGSSEWLNQPVVSVDAPVRYTIVSKGGVESWYIYGVLRFQHKAYGPGSLLLQAIEANVGLREVSYWPEALIDVELAGLFARS